MQNKVKVYVDSACDIHYSSFYIFGLQRIFGKKNVKFSNKYFKQFKLNNHFFAFLVRSETNIKKVIIDYTDSKHIDLQALEWSDVYGKINLDLINDVPEKVVIIGPSFGINIFSLFNTMRFSFINLIRSGKRITNVRRFLSNYKSQYKRPKLEAYRSQPSSSNAIYFMSSLWKQEAETNNFRANFIRSCRHIKSIHFAGGFAPRTRNDIKGFEDLTVQSRVSMKFYLSNLKKSLLVFNTPAVKGCHGWKLAEYLCLGKPIISTALLRKLPEPLKNYEHVLFTTGEIEDITMRVNEIISDQNLKEKLSTNARLYFNKYLTPEKSIKRLLD